MTIKKERSEHIVIDILNKMSDTHSVPQYLSSFNLFFNKNDKLLRTEGVKYNEKVNYDNNLKGEST
jgi:hypothetical protein